MIVEGLGCVGRQLAVGRCFTAMYPSVDVVAVYAEIVEDNTIQGVERINGGKRAPASPDLSAAK